VQWLAHAFRSRPEASWPRPDAPTTELWRFLRDALHANARERRRRLECPARRHLDVLTLTHAEASVASTFILGTGERKATLGAWVYP
jgi:hypothetical protein